MLHLYLLEHGGGFILKKLLISNASLIFYFESLLEQHGICYGYKFGPRMMSIQVGYNKNFHRSALNNMRSLILDNCFEI